MTVDKVKPKKALGQHFLTDLSVAGRIAATLSDYVGVPVIEVGPGMGVLTRFLLDGGHDLTVVELDRESVEYLQANFPQLHGRIVEADFLRLDLAELTRGREFCVIGNYPYNISSQIFSISSTTRIWCRAVLVCFSVRWPSVWLRRRAPRPGGYSACCCSYGTGWIIYLRSVKTYLIRRRKSKAEL